MTLLNALQARTARHPYLARSAWLTTITLGPYESCFVQPTDTPDGCLLISNQTGRITPWNPTEAGLLAEDWEVCAGNCAPMTIIADAAGDVHYSTLTRR